MRDLKPWMRNYLHKQHELLFYFDFEKVQWIIETLNDVRKLGKNIFVMGNGGSASNASHFATDLGKSASDAVSGKRFKITSLNENLSWITAIGNDYSYEDIFVKQLENYAQPLDVLMMLGVSGNSPNIIKAARWAKEKGLITISFMADNGDKSGEVKKYSDECMVIPDTHYGRVEDMEMTICHLIAYSFIENK
jgi:D-sedoheptulose 7-phosphate isomerase